MDLLSGYGSGQSDSEDEHTDRVSAPPQPIVKQVSFAKPSLFSSLPSVKSISVPVRSAASAVSSSLAAATTSATASKLPSNFFDPPTATTDTLPPLPADFFDSDPHPPTSTRPRSPPVLGPSRPNHSPHTDHLAPRSSSLWSQLPAPKSTGRNIVNFTLPLKTNLLRSKPIIDDDVDDLPRPAKKLKPSNGKSSLFDILPAPKHASASTANMDPFDPFSKPSAPKQTPQQTLAEPSPSTSMYSNEMYRADAPPHDSSSDLYAYQQPGSALPHATPSTHHHPLDNIDPSSSTYTHEQYEPQPSQVYYNPASTQAYYDPGGIQPPGPGATPEEEDIFQEALKAEREMAAKRGTGAASEIKFVELNQQDLKYVPPAKQESHNALQNALGSEYAQEIRGKAKAYLGSKTARKKHQIGTLFHNAKMMELEMMEQRAQSMKTKRETQAKYGW